MRIVDDVADAVHDCQQAADAGHQHVERHGHVKWHEAVQPCQPVAGWGTQNRVAQILSDVENVCPSHHHGLVLLATD